MAPMTKKDLARRIALETDDTKYCARCKIVRPLIEFHLNSKGRKFAMSECRSCRTKIDRERRHNITPKDYTKLFRQQNGKCAICGIVVSGNGHAVLHVDHDHKIKNKRDAVRGLLCVGCNHGLGSFRDNPEALAAAAAYLLRAKNRKRPLLGEKE